MCDDKMQLGNKPDPEPSPDPAPAPSPTPSQNADPTPQRQRSTPPLSTMELKVYALLNKRMTERQAAEELGRSPNTVHVHVRNIYRKLGIRTRQELYELAKTNPTAIRSKDAKPKKSTK